MPTLDGEKALKLMRSASGHSGSDPARRARSARWWMVTGWVALRP